ncbi:energy transducer TonB [Bradyrhizobium sp. dw_78]|uniref:energy transducer TonB n=1 Tax=Bradyrhizobium sp. dw_78 TaxID=2719793 RepID=UPI001BD1F2AE|nr:energy transducer TonB [Bradyrhizobium sp. dw_78]
MMLDDAHRQNTVPQPTWSAADLRVDEPDIWSTRELQRLIFVPALVGLFFIGGVYWLRLQLSSGSAGQEQPTVVQVHLIPRPDPVPIPVDAASEPIPARISHAETADRPDPATFDNGATESLDKAWSPAETAVPSLAKVLPQADSSSNSATLKFQQALMRHIAKFQRYPNAARGQQLQGAVETLFSIGRDGRLLGVWVKTSSGQTLLDKEAIETIKRAQPLPSIPSELPDHLNIQVQLAFDPS